MWTTRSGFIVRCIEPMRKWRIDFKGQLKLGEGAKQYSTVGPDERDPNAKLFPAEFSLEWTNFGETKKQSNSRTPI